ncbi:MAG: hypothetical protein HY282_07000 [Nitrospirae bacterium]|nr:hypothetical protein [Candidatus Manganitrophaceae bacterium]
MRWSENIVVNAAALFLILSLLHAGFALAQSDPKAAAQDSANQALSKFGSTSGIRDNASVPLTSGSSPMKTIDNTKSFNAGMSCPSSTKFLNVLVAPSGTGDLSQVLVGQDTDLDGAVDYSYQPPFPVSGVCANGVVSCTPGQWANCHYYQWTADSTGRANLQEVSPLSLGGCYCVNNSCGSNLAMTNLPSVLKNIGGGVVGSVQAKNPKLAITDVKVDGLAVSYYGQNEGACIAGTPSSPEQYYSNPGGISGAVGSQIALQSSDPASYYNLMTTTPPATQSSSTNRLCAIQRTVAITTQQTFCQNPAPAGAIASSENTVYLKVLAGTFRNRNDCVCTNVTGYCSPPSAAVFATPPVGSIPLGTSAENFRDRGKKKGKDDCTYDAYDYYSLCTRTSDIFSEAVTDHCSALDTDPNCRLRAETVDTVSTYNGFNPTGLGPLSSCSTLIGQLQNYDICRSWWKKDRTYLCQNNPVFDFTDAQRRAGAVRSGVADNITSMHYQDLRKDQYGNWISEQKDTALPGRDSNPSCDMACKTRAPVSDTQASVAGTTEQFRNTTNGYNFYYKKCANNACPLSAGEEVVKTCQCVSDFAEAASLMQVLQNAGKDMICSNGTKQ